MRLDHHIFQEERSDCGMACLVIAARLLGKEFDLAVLKSQFPASVSGMNLVQLLAIGEQLGLRGRPLRLEADSLQQLELPAILHFGVFHFAVLERVEPSGHFSIIDPAMGQMRLTLAQLSARFSGVAIELKPAEGKVSPRELPTLSQAAILRALPNVKPRLAAILLVALCAQAGLFLFPVFIKFIIEQVLIPKNAELLVPALLAALAMLAAVISFRALKHNLISDMIADIDSLLARYLNHLALRLDYSVFSRKPAGTIAQYFSSIRNIRRLISEGYLDALVDLVTLTVLIALCTFLSPLFGLAVTGVTLLHVFLQLGLARRRRPLLKRLSILDAQESTVLRENLRNIQAIKVCGYEAERDLIWQTANRRAAAGTAKLRHLEGRAELLAEVVLNGSRFALVSLAAWFAIDSRLSLGTVLVLTLYLALITVTLSGLLTNATRLWDINLYLRDASLLALEPTDPMSVFATGVNERGAAPQPKLDAPAIKLHDVGFRYEANRPRVLRRVNLTVHRGEFVAITGKSGTGKSTVLKLALGLFQPETGSVQLSGNAAARYRRDQYARLAGTVMQEDQLFSGSILQNISGFDPDPDFKRVEQACDLACATSFIAAANGGLYAQVFPGAELLSTGEKQRLFLARALYQGAEVLLLDEFTGNLDPETEKTIFTNLRNAGKTVLMTAHRGSTIGLADRVFRLSARNRTLEEVTE